MRQRTGPIVGPCLAGLLLLVYSGLTSAQEPVRLTNGDWAPYLQPKPPYGIVSQIVEAAFAEAGIPVTWGFFPWSRSYVLARDGRWDGAAAWSCSRERFKEFFFSEPLLPFDYVFFYRRDRDFDWQSIEDLKGLRIGLTQNYVYGDTIRRIKESGIAELDVTTSDEINFRKLLAGRIDLFPMDAVVGEVLLSRLFSADQVARLAIHPKVVHSANLHLLLSRRVTGNRGRMEQFNTGLKALRRRGGVKAIVATLSQGTPLITTDEGIADQDTIDPQTINPNAINEGIINDDSQRTVTSCHFDVETVSVGDALHNENKVSNAGPGHGLK